MYFILILLKKAAVPHFTEEELGSWMCLTAVRLSSQLPNVLDELKSSLLKLRDFLRSLKPSASAHFHAAADIVHFYAHTRTWFIFTNYNTVTSPPLEDSELGLETDEEIPLSIKQRSYSGFFVLSTLLSWFNPMLDKPETNLTQHRRLFFQLPAIKPCFAANARHKLTNPYELAHRQILIDALTPDKIIQYEGNNWKDKFFQFDTNMISQPLGSPYFDFLYCSPNDVSRLNEIRLDLEKWTPELDESNNAFFLHASNGGRGGSREKI